jgi:hypothetical protein
MPLNQLKTYNQLLEILHLSETERTRSLKNIFKRDIQDNEKFIFNQKIIRPHKKLDGSVDFEVLFDHLTKKTVDVIDEKGKEIKSRSQFDYKRSERLHWIKHHIDQKSPDKISVFSYEDKVRGRRVIRTYIFDESEQYIIILEPYRSTSDYYLISAYYLTKELGGVTQILNKQKRKLPEIH